MKRQPLPDVLKIRKRLCLDLAEMIESHAVEHWQNGWDIDQVAELIYARLPMTYDEAEAEYQAAEPVEISDERLQGIVDYATKLQKPSVIAELREALGFDKRVSLVETIKAATERVKTLAEMDKRLLGE